MPSASNVTVLLLAVIAAGCSSTPIQVPTRALPPASLLAHCPEPVAKIITNGDLARYALSLQEALRLCNDDKAALRGWAEEKS